MMNSMSSIAVGFIVAGSVFGVMLALLMLGVRAEYGRIRERQRDEEQRQQSETKKRELWEIKQPVVAASCRRQLLQYIEANGLLQVVPRSSLEVHVDDGVDTIAISEQKEGDQDDDIDEEMGEGAASDPPNGIRTVLEEHLALDHADASQSNTTQNSNIATTTVNDESIGIGVQSVTTTPSCTSSSCCTICLSDYKPDDSVVASDNLDCTHTFHSDCIVDYLVHHHMKQQKHRHYQAAGSVDDENEPATSSPVHSREIDRDHPSAPCPCCRRPFIVGPFLLEDSNINTEDALETQRQ
mmetsp:Transcript_8666/g.24912  ORF Transcript_8666/g.24912 Transcript_8666/m.24912 type:complete len:297 (-) Transcript_8666:284-1174(-)